MSWEEKQNKIKKIEDIKHRRQELADIAVRLKRGQEASYLRGNKEYKQPDVIDFLIYSYVYSIHYIIPANSCNTCQLSNRSC